MQATIIQRKWKQWKSAEEAKKKKKKKRKKDELKVLPEEVEEEEEEEEEEDFDVLAEEEDGDEHAIEALFIRCGSVTIEKSKRSVEEKNRRNEQQDCELEKQAIIAYEIEQLHNSKSSASKDRLLARLLQRVSIHSFSVISLHFLFFFIFFFFIF